MSAQNRQYTCVIVDDEALARELIETHLKHFEQFQLVASCASAIEASRVLNERPIDLLFLDIEMPVMKGTEFIRGLKVPPKVIFTTAYRDYAVDGFELEAVDYLLKPIVFARFFKSIERFLKAEDRADTVATLPGAQAAHIFVRHDRKELKLLLDEILYVRAQRDYLEIHTEKNAHTIKGTITEFAERLGEAFVRIHRSYLVNSNRVTAVTRHDVEIGDIELPIGDSFRSDALQKIGIT